MSNNVNVGTKELGAIANEDDDNPEEVIGFLKFSTTGEMFVPRKWLLDQWDEFGLPETILPSETSNWQAFRRTISYLKEQTEYLEYSVQNETYGMELDCELEIKKSNELGSNVYLVYARTFFPEEICGKEGGNWSENRVGRFDFHRPDDSDIPGAMIHNAEIDDDNPHYPHLEQLFNEARDIEKRMRKTHNFNDIQSILEDYREFIADAVEIRRSVYFVPANHEETLNGLMNIWDKMNQFKENGEEVRIDKTPVVNMSEQRELVASRVREKLEGMVDDIVSEIIGEFEENEEQTADEAAREILEELQEGENTASRYNQLLGTRLKIKEMLEGHREELKEESEEVIENVLEQQTFDEEE